MEMSRQRLRPGMIEATTQPCNHCHGTGLIRSDDNLALNILRQLEEEGVRLFTMVQGDYFTVMGMPLTELLNHLILRGQIDA